MRWLQIVEMMYSSASAEVKEKFADRYAKRHEMTEVELVEFFKELYREVFPNQPLAKTDDPSRYEAAEDVEVVGDVEEVVEEEAEVLAEVEEVVEDDAYVGKRVVEMAWRWST
ncbi:MAG: hypothetical protein QXI07_08980 [Pyrobaculum sp.]